MRSAACAMATLFAVPLVVAAGALAGTSRICLAPVPDVPRARRGWLERLLAFAAPAPLEAGRAALPLG